MKKKLFTKTTIIAIAAIITIGIGNAQNNPRIMVFDFDAGAGITQNQVSSLSSILTVYLQEEFDVVSLEEIDRIINEQGFQRAAMTEQQMEVVDNLLNVAKIITGSINTRRGEYRILATSIDTETGTVITTVGETGGRFHRVAQQMAQSLLAEMKRSEVPVPQEVAAETLLGFDAANRGVLINGVRWAASNVDVQAGTFVPSPELAGRLNAWGERSVWREIRFVPSERGGEVPNIRSMIRMRDNAHSFIQRFMPELRTDFERFRDDELTSIHDEWESFRAVEAIWTRDDPCPPGWRIPYPDEFESLIASGSFWTTVNGVGGRVFGTAPNQIFLPAAGGGGADPTMDHIPTHVAHEGQIGYYWTRNSRLPTSNIAYRLRISQVDATVGVDGHISNLDFGFSVRCVVQTDNIYVEF